MELSRVCVVNSLTISFSRRLVNTSRPLYPQLSQLPARFAGFHRCSHTQQLTKDMLHISNVKQKLKLDPNTLKLEHNTENPLCIMLMYLMAQPKHMVKYADLYLQHDFDVIAVTCTPLQVMWPVIGTQVIAERLLAFLETNQCGSTQPLVVHGFSVGAYVWSELLVKAIANKERYEPVLRRVTGQVWDSPADVDDTPDGIPYAVFPNNRPLQIVCRNYIRAHMRIFNRISTKHYMTATTVYHKTPCKAPGLFLVSKTDPIGGERNSMRAAAAWEKLGIKCNFKCWDQSPHVQHYLQHPEEYRATLYSHLNECGSIGNISHCSDSYDN